MLVDNHLPYPSVVLRVFGEVPHRRRKPRHLLNSQSLEKPYIVLMDYRRVQFVKNSINLYVWRSLSTTQGNEVIDGSAF